VAPVLPWRKASTETLRQRLLVPAWVGTAAVAAAVLLGARGLAPLIAFGLAGFAGGAAVRQLVLATRRLGWRGLVGRTNGGMVVHLGVVLIAVAFAASSSYATQRELFLRPGESATVAGHDLTYLRLTENRSDPAKLERIAQVRVDGGQVYEPALQRFPNGTQEIGTPSVRTNPVDDVYLALLDAPDAPDGPVRLRVIVSPLVLWLWIGGGVLALGSVLAAFPGGRRRRGTEPASQPVADVEHSPDDRVPVGAVR
jgi:cytochrome c-type biogenesis protein CcmF